MSARNCISTVTVPSPSQVSQRPPGTLKEKCAGAEAAAFGVGLGGEEGADVVEGLDVGHGIRARRAADGRLIDEDDVVEVLGAGERAEEVGWLGRGGVGFAVERLHERTIEDLVDECGFAAAADAGDAAEEVEGDLDIDAAQVMQADAGELEGASRPGSRRWRGTGMVRRPERYFPVMELRVGGDFGDGAGGEDVAAKLARAGAEVEEMVGGADDGGVVLDDEDGVAEIAQGVEDADELGGVAGMQADGGLVQYIECADQARAERCGELDALRFAAGERGGEAVEGEVFEANLDEEVDALADLFEDLAGDLGLRGGEFEVVEEGLGGGDGEGGDFADIFVVDEDGAGLGAEALAVAVGAEGVAAVLREEDADVELIFFALEGGEEAADAGVRAAAGPFQRRSCCGGSRSYQGTSVGMAADLAKRIISPWKGRYLGVVQGAMAPWARVRLRSGRMRLGSKSMVLPKPWQRGQAP